MPRIRKKLDKHFRGNKPEHVSPRFCIEPLVLSANKNTNESPSKAIRDNYDRQPKKGEQRWVFHQYSARQSPACMLPKPRLTWWATTSPTPTRTASKPPRQFSPRSSCKP